MTKTNNNLTRCRLPINLWEIFCNYSCWSFHDNKNRGLAELVVNMEAEKKKTMKAIVVGGSIAGLSCAHALINAGWEVTVVEKSLSPPTGSPTGAGLSLEPQAREVINRWLADPTILHDITFPLTVELVHSFPLLVFSLL